MFGFNKKDKNKKEVKNIMVRWDGIPLESAFSVGPNWIPLGGNGIDCMKMRFNRGVLEIKQLRMFSSTTPKDMKLAIKRLEDEGYA